MAILFWLVVGHAVADYPLQGDFLARGKNHRAPITGVPWWQCLIWHSMMHAGSVALVTGSVPLGLAEFVIHFGIDYGKCDGWYGFNMDQSLHVVCKVAWVCALSGGVA